ncbi:MAG: type VI secretion system tip protein TssI/VgrG [Candidatus Vecturithrix sp.]|jgi:type VI secretion system secreted protein VgrG|nr:type VI secretion system tip protein TssI/VgrG [Candidatus Vecturithrix sp.]
MNTSIRSSEAQFLFKISGAPAMRVTGFTASEQLSEPYDVSVDFSCPQAINLADMMEKEALLTVLGKEKDRYFHGIVFRMEYRSSVGTDFHRQHLHAARIVPFTQLLSLKQDCRIFQNKQVQEIVADIFKDSKVPSDRYEFRIRNKEHRRRYCVQYRETDLAFIHRILREEGIYYFYEHSQGKHVMVFADDPSCHGAIAGKDSITFKPPSGLNSEKEIITNIDFSHRLHSGTYTQTNYNFKHPSAPLETKEQSKDEGARKYEIYDFPGQYGETGRGQKLTKAHMEGHAAIKDQCRGSGNCPRLIPGFTFKLDSHDFSEFNREYFLTEVTHSGEQPQSLEENATGQTTYSNHFTTIPAKTPYRPLPVNEKPYIPGVQTATVVGPENEEIYVDEHGRVKVQFHWDRKGKKDERSSCWLRCGQTWGGSGWGSMFIPRVGDEVLINFMEGDPDWPVIVGSVYNGKNPPLYDLPANKTRSTIKTQSYPNSNGYHELRFEDKAHQEEIYFQSEKDWNILIKHDKGQTVGHDETLAVAHNRDKTVAINQSESIGVNKTINVGINHTESIDVNMTRNVGMNKFDTTVINSMETVGLAKELTIGGLYQISVGGVMNETVIGAKTEEVGAARAVVVAGNMTEYVMGDRKSTTDGDLTRTVGKVHHRQAEEYILEAKEKIILKAGASTIVMDKNSITITSPKKVTYPGPGANVPAFEFKQLEFNDKFQLLDENTGEPLANHSYRLEMESGMVIEGLTDAHGCTQMVKSTKNEVVSILVEV